MAYKEKTYDCVLQLMHGLVNSATYIAQSELYDCKR